MDSTFVARARARANQQQLLSNLKSSYDFIVCGSGSSGSVVARRLAENPDVSVLLLEAGGSDEVASIEDPLRWPENLGTERDWAFKTRPNPDLNDRSLVWSMGRVLGGSSSLNLMVWARGHQQDWDAYGEAAADPAWSYAAVLERYRRIESWQGVPDAVRRGRNGLVYVAPASPKGQIAFTMLDAAKSVGIPTYADHNGSLMESDSGGAALSNLRIQDGKRQSVYRTYVYPYLDRPNLTVLTNALVTRVLFEGRRATGAEVVLDGNVKRFTANLETILSLGAVQTPKVLMQSGIGEAGYLQKWDIPVVRNLPGVGQNLQEHVLIAGCLWEYAHPEQQHPQMADGTFFWKSDSALRGPDLQCFIIEAPFLSPASQSRAPAGPAWTILPGLVRPKSRGRLYLTGSAADAPVDIDARILSEPADRVALRRCVELCREIGNSRPFEQFRRREAYPGSMSAKELDTFISEATVPFWHYVGTAKMGQDEMSVVDGQLRVHGIDGLRVADGSVFPEVPTGNTMAPCVMVGEIAAELLKAANR